LTDYDNILKVNASALNTLARQIDIVGIDSESPFDKRQRCNNAGKAKGGKSNLQFSKVLSSARSTWLDY